MGHVLEAKRDLGQSTVQAFAGPQVERDAGPAPVVDLQPERREGLGGRVRRDAVDVSIALVLA